MHSFLDFVFYAGLFMAIVGAALIVGCAVFILRNVHQDRCVRPNR